MSFYSGDERHWDGAGSGSRSAASGWLEIRGDPRPDSLAQLAAELRLLEQCEQLMLRDDPAPGQLTRENQVFLPEGGVLGDGEVMGIETQAADAFGISRREVHESAPPSLGKSRRTGIDRVNVIPIRLVELRVNAYDIQPFGPVDPVGCDQVHFERGQYLVG